MITLGPYQQIIISVWSHELILTEGQAGIKDANRDSTEIYKLQNINIISENTFEENKVNQYNNMRKNL